MSRTDQIFRITGTGCSLVDYLYQPVSFTDAPFRNYLSRVPGDGGLSPGKLVFTGELEKFTGKRYSELRDEITGGKKPAATNIGGPSVVSLIHASQMLPDLNADIAFYGCRGNDEAGRYIEEKLALTPLRTGFYKTGEKFTPFTDVLSDPDYDDGHGERVFINNIGAAGEFVPTDLDKSFFNADIVVFGGTALVPQIHASLGELLRRSRENGAFTVVNTVYDFINEKKNPGKPWPMGSSNKTYSYIDLLLTDREEALRHSGAGSVCEAISWFKKLGTGAVVITQGPNPVVFYGDSDLFGQVPVSEIPVSERVKSDIKRKRLTTGDTTGCGDNFAGGVLASAARQMIEHPGRRIDLLSAVAFGVASGGFTCFYMGGTWFEKAPGEKMREVNSLYHEYMKQTGH